MNALYRHSSLPNLPAGLRRPDPAGPWMLEDEEFLKKMSSNAKVRERKSRDPVQLIRTLAELQMTALFSVVSAPATLVIKDLQLLREEEELSGEPITHHSYSTAKNVLEYVHAILGEDIPQPHLAPDGIGGIRMEWFQGDTNVRVVIPPQEDQRMYIYQLVDGVSNIQELSNSAVVRTLRSHILAQ